MHRRGTFASGAERSRGPRVRRRGQPVRGQLQQQHYQRVLIDGRVEGDLRLGAERPPGLAFDAAGNLYVVNFDSNTVSEFSSTGASKGTFASGLSVRLPRLRADALGGPRAGLR